MSPLWRSTTLAALVTLAGVSHFLAGDVRAQSRSYTPNTYADFPYNQGSLFYRPLGANAYKRPSTSVVRPRARVLRRNQAPQPTYVLPQGAYYYQQPPVYYYYPQGYQPR